MSVVGIICEYNPFHNGHLHHLQKAKEIANGDVVIAILTGYFSMRGDISVLNKYDKIKTAIDSGVDITIELPYLLGTQNADIFAYNSVYLLNKMGVQTIVSGSESCDIDKIKKIYEIEKNIDFQNQIKNNLKTGSSYRKSYTDALTQYDLTLNSNDMLNIKYYEAIQKINPNITLTLIQRINNDYNDKTLNDTNIQSATSLRLTENIKGYVPDAVNEIYEEKGFYNLNEFSMILKHLISTTDLSNIHMATEGIENSFKTDFKNIDDLIEKLTTKRYTSSRIRRLITYILTNTKKDSCFDVENTPVRVTGFSDFGQKYLSLKKKDTKYFTRFVEGINSIYDKEFLIAKIFSNIYDEDFIKLEQKLPYKK